MKLMLGVQFKMARDKLGLSQGEVSKAIGISRSYYSEIENDLKIPTIEIFLSISKFLKIKPNLFEEYEYYEIEIGANYIAEELKELSLEESQLVIDTIKTMVKGIKKIKR